MAAQLPVADIRALEPDDLVTLIDILRERHG